MTRTKFHLKVDLIIQNTPSKVLPASICLYPIAVNVSAALTISF